MRINSKEFDSFCQNLPKNAKSLLIYGVDYGAIQENLEKIKYSFLGKKFDSLSFSNLMFSDVKDRLELIYEEINNYNFFTQKKLVIISEISANIDESFKKLINSVPENNFIVFTAKELPPNSSFRKFFEAEKDIFSLPVYQEEEKSLKSLASEILKNKNLTWEEKFLDYFVKYNKGNRLAFVKELEKIISFLKNKNHIILEEVIDIIGKTEENNFEDCWLNLFLGKELMNMEKNIYLCADSNNIAILRSLNNFIFKLIEILEINSRVKDFKQSFKLVSPPVFFKKIPQYELIMGKVDISGLNEIMAQIRELEVKIKSYGEITKPLISEFLRGLSRKLPNES